MLKIWDFNSSVDNGTSLSPWIVRHVSYLRQSVTATIYCFEISKLNERKDIQLAMKPLTKANRSNYRLSEAVRRFSQLLSSQNSDWNNSGVTRRLQSDWNNHLLSWSSVAFTCKNGSATNHSLNILAKCAKLCRNILFVFPFPGSPHESDYGSTSEQNNKYICAKEYDLLGRRLCLIGFQRSWQAK